MTGRRPDCLMTASTVTVAAPSLRNAILAKSYRPTASGGQLRVHAMRIRQADAADFDRIWPFFSAIVAAGDTYAYPRDITRNDGYRLWMTVPRRTFVAERGSTVLDSYTLKANQPGPGRHVCNCGYMVSEAARGQGVATRMCEHSQQIARELGYKAMQFNFVAGTNTRAVRLWETLGFAVVGRLPGAFEHPALGYVDALIMYKWLAAERPA